MFICCCLIADVFYCFVAVVYHEGIFIYLFSRHEKFFYSFVPSCSMLFIAFLLLFIPQSLIIGTDSFSFSLCFYWHLVALLSHFGVVKTLLYFLRHFKFFKLFVASWSMLFTPWCCCCLSRRLFIYLFIRFLFAPYDWCLSHYYDYDYYFLVTILV